MSGHNLDQISTWDLVASRIAALPQADFEALCVACALASARYSGEGDGRPDIPTIYEAVRACPGARKDVVASFFGWLPYPGKQDCWGDTTKGSHDVHFPAHCSPGIALFQLLTGQRRVRASVRHPNLH